VGPAGNHIGILEVWAYMIEPTSADFLGPVDCQCESPLCHVLAKTAGQKKRCDGI
jgi:hypothetical protein